MKKKVFRERYFTFTVDEPTEEAIKKSIERQDKMVKDHLDAIEEMLQKELKEPKKRGRRKSVKSDK